MTSSRMTRLTTAASSSVPARLVSAIARLRSGPDGQPDRIMKWDRSPPRRSAPTGLCATLRPNGSLRTAERCFHDAFVAYLAESLVGTTAGSPSGTPGPAAGAAPARIARAAPGAYGEL